MKNYNKKRRRKKIIYTLQIAWIITAMITSIMLLMAGNRLLGIDLETGAINEGTVNAQELDGSNNFVDNKGVTTEEKSSLKEDIVKSPSESGDYGENLDPIVEDTKGSDHSDSIELGSQDSIEPIKEPDSQDSIEPTKEPSGQQSTEQSSETTNQESENEVAEDVLANQTIDATKPMLALTFDDGPYPLVTNRILDALSKYNAHATFFVMGNRMDSYGSTVQRAFELGNQIGNHTHSHKDLTKLSIEKLRFEVEYSNELINQYAKEGNAVLRPPYGNRNEVVCNNILVPMIAWSVDPEDWKSRDKDKVSQHILSTVQDGDIILMHDLYESTAEAIEYLIPELINQGYQLVTIDELFAAKGYALEAGKIYHNGRGQ